MAIKEVNRRKKEKVSDSSAQNAQVSEEITMSADSPPDENIQYVITEPEVQNTKKTKRARKATSTAVQPNIMGEDDLDTKKRGRKPKGGKIILKACDTSSKPNITPNIILHLKCSLNDLNDYNTSMNQKITNPLTYNPSIPPSILTYNMDEKRTFSLYKNEKEPETELCSPIHYAYHESDSKKSALVDNVCNECKNKYADTNNDVDEEDENINMKDINSKLKKLKIQLYKNAINDKKSACFWCTYDFDNPPCYIPKFELDERIIGYGAFCRPECAVAFLMKENIDDSTKFERYHILNQIYSKIYDYKKNIKPAPNPYYLLEKFYGTFTIQEYRKLLKSEHMLLVIDKPLTRILPELHEDNEEFLLNIFGNNKTNTSSNASGVYKVKKQSEKQQGPSKNSIMREKFGMAQ